VIVSSDSPYVFDVQLFSYTQPSFGHPELEALLHHMVSCVQRDEHALFGTRAATGLYLNDVQII
jgi:hypothetical protein